jgi:fatty acid desaturase
MKLSQDQKRDLWLPPAISGFGTAVFLCAAIGAGASAVADADSWMMAFSVVIAIFALYSAAQLRKHITDLDDLVISIASKSGGAQ